MNRRTTADRDRRCPACRTRITQPAKYCPECGTGLGGAAPGHSRMAAVQEIIKQIRENDRYFTVLAAVGAVTAIAVPYITRYILLYAMDRLAWLLTIVGIVFFIAGNVGLWYDHRKVKDLTDEIRKGRE